MDIDAEIDAAQQRLNRKIGQMARRAHEAIRDNAESAQRIVRSSLPLDTIIDWLHVQNGHEAVS